MSNTDVAFYDVFARRLRGGGGTYLLDARLLLGDGTSVLLEDGYAHKVPARIAHAVNDMRSDLYIVPSSDQTPPPVVSASTVPELTDNDFEPLPADAVVGAAGASGESSAPVIENGHRVPPGRPELSEEEQAQRKAEAAAYLDQLPPDERPDAAAAAAPAPLPASTSVEASDGQPILVPFGVSPGATPGWPTDGLGRPLRLPDSERRAAAAAAIAKTAGDPANPDAPVNTVGHFQGGAVPESVLSTTADVTAADAPAPAVDGAPVLLLAPVPQGFSDVASDGTPRCIAVKGDKSQCQNRAGVTPGHPQACHLAPHQGQVAETAAVAAATVA